MIKYLPYDLNKACPTNNSYCIKGWHLQSTVQLSTMLKLHMGFLFIMNNFHFLFHLHILSILLLIYMYYINPKLGFWTNALINWELHSFQYDLVITSDKLPQMIPKFSSRTVVILILKKGKDIAPITSGSPYHYSPPVSNWTVCASWILVREMLPKFPPFDLLIKVVQIMCLQSWVDFYKMERSWGEER